LSEEDDDDSGVDAEEMERQHKRELAVRKAIKFILKDKCPDGFPLSELVEKLATVNVKGFKPEICGYKSLEKFVKGQQRERALRYDRNTQMILPRG